MYTKYKYSAEKAYTVWGEKISTIQLQPRNQDLPADELQPLD